MNDIREGFDHVDIISIATDQCVITAAAANSVIPCKSIENIAASRSDNQIVALTANDIFNIEESVVADLNA